MKPLLTTLCLTLAVLLGSVGVSFAMPPCPEQRHPTNTPWFTCFGTYTYSSGEKYDGEFKNDKIDGKGTATLTTADKYVGEHKQ